MATLLATSLADVRDATMSNIGDDIDPFVQERVPFKNSEIESKERAEISCVAGR
jgi:hypothetical protein